MTIRRRNYDQPAVVSRRGWRYHHVGIPTTVSRPGEHHLKRLKIYVCGFDTSPFGIEWMRFETGCRVHELVRTVPHVAFEVDDLDSAVEDETLLGEIGSPSQGVRVAMIVDNGAPIELIEFAGRRARRTRKHRSTRCLPKGYPRK